jgi:hypothetical protein
VKAKPGKANLLFCFKNLYNFTFATIESGMCAVMKSSSLLSLNNVKGFGFKATLLATMVSLAACGGGGSEGYYGGNSNGTGGTGGGTTTPIPNPVATNYHIVLSTNKPTLVATGDTAVITVKLVDVNGGGVADEEVTLSIPDTVKYGVTIDGASKSTTDASGNATFNIKLVASNIVDKAGLLANGLKINSSYTDDTKKVTAQTTILKVVESLTPSTSTSQYRLTLNTNKPTLVVTGDSAIVTVKAVDTNGGGVAGQNVVLSIPDSLTNGVTINGSSTLVTDATGNASFTVLLPAVRPVDAAALIAKDVLIRASLTDANGVTTKQETLLDVVATPVAVPVGNITFGRSAELQKSDDGAYYTESLSVNLVDIDGKPIINQPVVMKINLSAVAAGQYRIIAEPKDGEPKRVPVNVCRLSTVGKPIATTFVSARGVEDGTVTYTTDNTGKFDFQVRFLRQYAGWQSVTIDSEATVSGKPVIAQLNYSLNSAKPDFDSDAGQPFDRSPYGTSLAPVSPCL